MKAAIDISGTFITQAGTTVYTWELIRALRKLYPADEFLEVAYKPKFSRERRLFRIYDTLCREAIWVPYTLKKKAHALSADVIHVPTSYAPSPPGLPLVVTVPDLHMLHYPEHFKRWQRNSFTYYLRKSMKAADVVITISKFVKDDLLDSLPWIPADKVMPVLLGYNPRFRVLPEEDVQPVRDKYGLDKPFILSVSTVVPNKNMMGLLKAFLATKEQIDHDLIFVGAKGWKHRPLEEIAAEMGLAERVRHLGYVPTEDLPAIYNLADMLAYPSLYEGFGLPPVEAMACGTPVVSANRTSIPEVVENAAVLVNPYDVDDIADGILRAASDVSLRRDLVRLGLERVKSLTWADCARKTMDVYASVVT